MQRILQRNKRFEGQALFQADGTCTVIIQVPPGPSWEVKQIGVKTTVTTNLTSCTTFVGTNSAGIFISSTLLGNSDTDSQPQTTVRYGESLCAVWTGGTPGRIGRMTVIYDEVGY